MTKTIFLLLGCKGSGKSFIGNLLDTEFGIRFLRVEDWAKAIKRERTVDNDAYVEEVFSVIEVGVRKELEQSDRIVFESTGLTVYFDRMLANLRRDFKVVTIGIKASAETCLARVQTRDKSIHIDVSDARVLEINRQVVERGLVTDFVVENEGKRVEKIKEELKVILSS